jgi:hypothetical protein
VTGASRFLIGLVTCFATHGGIPAVPGPTAFPDERLELIFTCCHPALSLDAQVALTLRTLGG